jgi:hypothetical protein
MLSPTKQVATNPQLQHLCGEGPSKNLIKKMFDKDDIQPSQLPLM